MRLTNPTLDYYSVFEYAFNAVDIGMITHAYFRLKRGVRVCICVSGEIICSLHLPKK